MTRTSVTQISSMKKNLCHDRRPKSAVSTYQGSQCVLGVQSELALVRLVLLDVQTDGGACRPGSGQPEHLAERTDG